MNKKHRVSFETLNLVDEYHSDLGCYWGRERPKRRWPFGKSPHFLVPAPDSSNASVVVAGNGAARSFGEHTEMTKGTWMYDGLIIHIIISKIAVIMFGKKIFRPNIFVELQFWAIFGQKLDKSSQSAELGKRRDTFNSQNNFTYPAILKKSSNPDLGASDASFLLWQRRLT